MTPPDQIVLVLDDDLSILSGLERLLIAHGYQVRLHSKPEDFFQSGPPQVPACLILDNQLGGSMTGVEVHAELQRRGWVIPTVFVTAHWNVQSVVHAMRAGADGFLTKPYDPAELVAAVAQALQRAHAMLHNGLQIADVRARAASLTPREGEIVRLVVAGLLNKEIADRLDLALVTVKVHRGRAMRKLGAGNSAELVRLAGLAGLIPASA
jgi:FixJ family two-component response regulator